MLSFYLPPHLIFQVLCCESWPLVDNSGKARPDWSWLSVVLTLIDTHAQRHGKILMLTIQIHREPRSFLMLQVSEFRMDTPNDMLSIEVKKNNKYR
jgi:hypothetical protein